MDGNTAALLSYCWFRPFFRVLGDRAHHLGLASSEAWRPFFIPATLPTMVFGRGCCAAFSESAPATLEQAQAYLEALTRGEVPTFAQQVGAGGGCGCAGAAVADAAGNPPSACTSSSCGGVSAPSSAAAARSVGPSACGCRAQIKS